MSTPAPVLLVIPEPRDPLWVLAQSSTVTLSGVVSGDSAVWRQADAGAPQVLVTDLGVTRGDGIFETISVCDGYAQALDGHLARLARSAAILDLPPLNLAAFRVTVLAAIAAHERVPEMFVKVVVTRGIEGVEHPSAWVYGATSADFSAERVAGIRVVTLDRGYRHDVAQTSPWLLQGAKTLSYAVNRAVLREAARRDAQDVIFVSSDGYVLEGPTSSVVLKFGQTLVTPKTDQGILAGTTQASVFDFAEQAGLFTQYRLVRPEELLAADGVWLVSSVRQSVPVNTVNGTAVAVDGQLTADISDFLLSRRV